MCEHRRQERQGGRVAGWHRGSVVALLLLAGLIAAGPAAWIPARPDYAWSFPRDHYSHDGYRTEWWYFTGQLTLRGDSAPRYGYQFTFFRVGLVPTLPNLHSEWDAKDLIMGHAALTDLTTGRHRFSELLYRATPLLGQFGTLPDSLIAWSAAPVGTPGRWTLARTGPGFALAMRDDRQGFAVRLRTVPDKPLAFEGPNGYSRKGRSPDAASQYYSFTRMGARGTIVVGHDTLDVSGSTWMDHEFGSNQLDTTQVGWDWFSLQLDDGRDVMLYLLRGRPGTPNFARGTVVDSAGQPRYLDADDWSAAPEGTWRSPATGTRYPSGWRVRVPSAGLDVIVAPLADAQEDVSHLIPDLFYWEGAVLVRTPDGRPVGRGYVELTGYGKGRKPAI